MSETKVAMGFDEIYLSAPETRREVKELRNDACLLLSDQAESFCREMVLFGKIPTVAYETAYATQDPDTLKWVKPDASGYKAHLLMRTPEVVERIKELRNEILTWYKMPREEMLMALRSIALDPQAKNSDRVNALKQIGVAEGYNIEKDSGGGAPITIIMPFAPKPLGIQKGVTIDMNPVTE